MMPARSAVDWRHPERPTPLSSLALLVATAACTPASIVTQPEAVELARVAEKAFELGVETSIDSVAAMPTLVVEACATGLGGFADITICFQQVAPRSWHTVEIEPSPVPAATDDAWLESPLSVPVLVPGDSNT